MRPSRQSCWKLQRVCPVPLHSPKCSSAQRVTVTPASAGLMAAKRAIVSLEAQLRESRGAACAGAAVSEHQVNYHQHTACSVVAASYAVVRLCCLRSHLRAAGGRPGGAYGRTVFLVFTTPRPIRAMRRMSRADCCACAKRTQDYAPRALVSFLEQGTRCSFFTLKDRRAQAAMTILSLLRSPCVRKREMLPKCKRTGHAAVLFLLQHCCSTKYQRLPHLIDAIAASSPARTAFSHLLDFS